MASTLERLAESWRIDTGNTDKMKLSWGLWAARHKTPASYLVELPQLTAEQAKILYDGIVELKLNKIVLLFKLRGIYRT
ncbi:hypothetical protein KBD71_00780 [Candidatus Woesebacteria bacterium]|nr:hypothetical protein [Candidatus Woesebacteria bacterium]